ncbi:MAG: hypothetical protein WAZ14_03675 [Patescibacteria group bacterium]
MTSKITPELRAKSLDDFVVKMREIIDVMVLDDDQLLSFIKNYEAIAHILGDALTPAIARFSEEMPAYTVAREILGNDFISPGEIEANRPGLVYSLSQWQELSNSVPSKEVLEWCRDNCFMLLPGPPRPMSLLDVRELDRGHFYSKENGWYAAESEAFARNDKATCRWLMLRKEHVPDSIEKTWDEQQQLLSSLEVTPNVAEQVWGMTTYKAVCGVYLLAAVYVRTSSVDLSGYRVGVGVFDGHGLDLYYWRDHTQYSNIGVSSSRK